MGTVKTRVFVSSEGIKKTVYLPPDKIQSDGNSTIIKWHVPDPNGDYEDSMQVNKTFEEVITLIQQASEDNFSGPCKNGEYGITRTQRLFR